MSTVCPTHIICAPTAFEEARSPFDMFSGRLGRLRLCPHDVGLSRRLELTVFERQFLLQPLEGT